MNYIKNFIGIMPIKNNLLTNNFTINWIDEDCCYVTNNGRTHFGDTIITHYKLYRNGVSYAIIKERFSSIMMENKIRLRAIKNKL